MTTDEPPRRPKPVTREHAEMVARRFHELYEELAPSHGYETREASRTDWSRVPPANKALMISVAYALLDQGVVIDLDHNECHALVEHLLETGCEIDTSEASPIDDAFKPHLRSAFMKLAFTNGRHYGLTNFDMGIEEDPS